MLEESDEEFVTLTHAARRGDRGAAQGVIGHYLPYWMRTAYGIIGTTKNSSIDPADLVQEAILKLLHKWSAGQGPESNTKAYVAAMMRNSFANRMRSPAAREAALDDIEGTRSFLTHDDVQEIDLSREAEAVRRAFATLSADHRTALLATTVEGRKPADLVEELGRSAPAISNLLVRAKHTLHRALLIDYLSAGGQKCEKNAKQLPSKVHAQPAEHADGERGLPHVRSCDSCRKNWRRFAAVSTAFGVLPLLTIGQWSVGAPPAAAYSGELPDRAPPPDTDSQATSSSGSTTTPASASASASASGRLLPPQAVSSTGTKVSRVLASTPVLVAGLALIAAAAVFSVLLLPFDDTERVDVQGADARSVGAQRVEGRYGAAGGYEPPSGTHSTLGLNTLDAELDVWMDVGEGRSLKTITTSISVGATEKWSMDSIELTLSPGAEFHSASNGLKCTGGRGSVRCIPSEATDLDSPFVFAVTHHAAGGTFELEVAAEAGGDRFSGIATGNW